MSSLAIEARSLRKTYVARDGGSTLAVDGVGLRVAAGEVYGLLGPRHAGKTTVLRMIAGRVAPDGGMALVGGDDILRSRRAAPRNLTARWRGGRALALPRLAERAALLLDEGTLGKDEAGVRATDEWLRRLRGEGKAVLLATRRPWVARDLCDRVGVMRGGRLLLEVTATELGTALAREFYRIRLKGRLDAHWSDWLGGLALAYGGAAGDETLLAGSLADQAALHGVLTKVRDLGLPLLSLERIAPDGDDLLACLDGFGRVSGGGGDAARARRKDRRSQVEKREGCD